MSVMFLDKNNSKKIDFLILFPLEIFYKIKKKSYLE